MIPQPGSTRSNASEQVLKVCTSGELDKDELDGDCCEFAIGNIDSRCT